MKILQATEGHAVRATDGIAHLDCATVIDADIISATAKIGCARTNDKRSAIIDNGLTVVAVEIEPPCRRATIDIDSDITRRRATQTHQVRLTCRRAAIEIDGHIATGVVQKNGIAK